MVGLKACHEQRRCSGSPKTGMGREAGCPGPSLNKRGCVATPEVYVFVDGSGGGDRSRKGQHLEGLRLPGSGMSKEVMMATTLGAIESIGTDRLEGKDTHHLYKQKRKLNNFWKRRSKERERERDR